MTEKRSANAIIATVMCTLVVAISLATFSLLQVAHAGEADVTEVRATQSSDGTWRFDVTVEHTDTGWEHYADQWVVIGPDGAVLGERVLLHPHVNEQPFTRSLSGVIIPDDVTTVTVRARDNVHEYGGAEIDVQLER
ncbi:MAG: hypothetical protein AAFP99_06595 [Pseudomonadota bacterium]